MVTLSPCSIHSVITDVIMPVDGAVSRFVLLYSGLKLLVNTMQLLQREIIISLKTNL